MPRARLSLLMLSQPKNLEPREQRDQGRLITIKMGLPVMFVTVDDERAWRDQTADAVVAAAQGQHGALKKAAGSQHPPDLSDAASNVDHVPRQHEIEHRVGKR